jgi:hypothetical protein
MSERRSIIREGDTPCVTKAPVALLTILPALVFLASFAFAQDTITNVMSPVVSYQYYDSLEHLGANSVIMSQAASYQYFDWPDAGSVQFLDSPAVSYFYSAVGTVSHVQTRQRPGTKLVDLSYDLMGAGSDYYVLVAVSSDGGATFTVSATHCTGDGGTSPTVPGTNRHIVWDAGADFPDQFSTQMRVMVMAGFAYGLSPIFTLDTRTVRTGTLTGLVQGDGTALPNAQARIDGTGFTATTGADGRFTLANVPAGSGYLLKVSAAGFASQQKPNITITSGTTDLGIIQLTPLAVPYRLVPLQPDVNPLVTQIEDGGVGYRYYRFMPVNANDNLGGLMVSLRLAGGSTISQAGDVSNSWAGRTAGLADDDGIVRLRIPASAIGGPGASATLEVMESGIVRVTFSAQVVARKYEQVWKKKWHGVAGVSLEGSSLGLGFGHETTVTREFGNGAGSKEIVGHWREEVYQAGVGVGDSVRVNRIGGGLSVQSQGRMTIGLGQSLHFDPQTTDPFDNVLKFYAAYMDALNYVPFGGTVIEGVQEQIMNLGSPIEANEGALRVTGSGEAEAGIGGLSPLPGDVAVHFWADESGDLEMELGAENHPGQYVDHHLEFGIGWGSDVQWKLTPQTLPTAMFQDRDNSLRATIRRTADDSKPSELIVRSAVQVTADTPRTVGGWLTDDLVQLRNQEVAEYKNTCTLRVPSVSDALPIALNVWQGVNNLGQGAAFSSGSAAEMVSSLLSAGQTVAYEKSVYSAETTVSTVLPNFDIVLSLDASAEDEKGAEMIKEAGIIWQNRVLGLEAYADQPRDHYPTETLSDLQGVWMANARSPLDQFVQKAGSTIVGGVDNVIHAGEGAVLWIGQGVMNAGSWVVTKFTSAVSGGGTLKVDYGPSGNRPMDGQMATNFVYGIGGIYRFESTNSFNGTGTLTIAYSPAEVTGFDPADLRIYYLPDGTNRWQLVGGTLDVVSSTVTATISQLGTYALAPPLPTGDLQLMPSTNTLAADGASEMTIVVTNIFLNTGEMLQPPPYVGSYNGSTTQQWIFTVTAVGVNILNEDIDTNAPGVQVMSTNGAVTLFLRAPVGGTLARVNLASVVGDASGSVPINLLDNASPATPVGVSVTAGKSRIWVSWQTNSEPEIAGYRVYYRLGASGPPWDGTAAVEGTPSPVIATGTNCLLRGLAPGTDYFVAVSAVDTTGNESSLSTPAQVTTAEAPPAPPTAAVARFGADGTNILMWALSEDDGYNDRDVARYDVLRAVLPSGDYVKVGEVAAGIGLCSETNLVVEPTQYVRYAVAAVASGGLSSAQTLANRLIASGNVYDNDGDGIADWWTLQYFGHAMADASDLSRAQDDPDQDGLTNLQEFQLGRNPLVADNAWMMVGFVRTPGEAGVAGVAVAGLAGTAATDTNGCYSATFPYGWSGSSTPSKTDDSTPANGISVADLAMIQAQVLGKLHLGPYQLLAADVNTNGHITVADLALIQAVILGKRTNFPSGLWRFVPADYIFPDTNSPWDAPSHRSYNNLVVDLTNADFIAIKLGDVNDSWKAPASGQNGVLNGPKAGAALAAAVPKVLFSVGQKSAQPGQTVTVQVTVSGFSQVSSVQFSLAWDPAVLRYKGTGSYGLTGLSAGSFGTRLVDSGKLAFAWYDPEATGATLADGTVLFTLDFEVIGKAGSISAVTLAGVPTAQEVSIDFTLAAFGSLDGMVSVVEPGVLVNKAGYVNGAFRLSVPTEKGRSYTLEFTESLTPAKWTALPAVAGDGTVTVLVDPATTNQQRFYRVRIQ